MEFSEIGNTECDYHAAFEQAAAIMDAMLSRQTIYSRRLLFRKRPAEHVLLTMRIRMRHCLSSSIGPNRRKIVSATETNYHYGYTIR